MTVEQLIGHPIHCATFALPRRLRRHRTIGWMVEHTDVHPSEVEHHAGFVGDLIVAAPKLHRVTSLPIDATEIPVAAIYNPTLHNFVTVMSRDAFVWDVDDGRRLAAFCDLSKGHDFNAACFDDRMRKFFLGRADSCIITVNLNNGAEMKCGETLGQVSRMVYHRRGRCLIVGTMRGALMVLDDEPQTHLGDLRHIEAAHPSAISSLAVSEELGIIVTGDYHGNIRFWAFEDMRCVSSPIFKQNRMPYGCRLLRPTTHVACSCQRFDTGQHPLSPRYNALVRFPCLYLHTQMVHCVFGKCSEAACRACYTS